MPEELFRFLLNNSITAAWVILAVLLLRLLLVRAPRRLVCLLWVLPGIRLALPFSVESILSLIPSARTVPPEILSDTAPAISSNIPAIDNAVNPMLRTTLSPAVADSVDPMALLMTAAGYAWLIGLAVMLALCLVSTLRLKAGLRMAVRTEEGAWRCETVSSPFVLGLLRPRIYLPYGLEGEALSHVLAHEREHIRRGDHVFKLLGYLLLCVYWFNPLIWLAYTLMGRDMEYACDEAVVAAMDAGQRKSYSLALLGCADRRHAAVFCPPAFGETGVKGRIKKVLKFKRPAMVISAVAVLLLIVAALCLLTNPKTDAAEPAPEVTESDQTPGVYMRMTMPDVYSLEVQYEGGAGGCVNADGTPFAVDELIWLEQLDGLTGTQGFLVRALDEGGDVLDQRTWVLDMDGESRMELNWNEGDTLGGPDETYQELSGDEAEQLRLIAERELKKLYELGVFSTELKLDGDRLMCIRHTEAKDMGEGFFGRIWPPSYTVNANNTDGYTFSLQIDLETEKLFGMTVASYAGEGDQPIADREPFVWEEGGTEYYYYDMFSHILPEDITIDQLCEKLNEYWGFNGYTLSGTKYEMYNYDTPAPDGSSPVKTLCDNPFLTVYFDGDQPGVPMYVDIINLPGNTNVMIGLSHAVG